MIYKISELTDWFNSQLEEFTYPSQPENLWEPVRYIMSLGGKRIRPALLLSGYDLYRDNIKYAFEAALAVEIFHNFSLVHDDIMDDAGKRRNQATTHIKYGLNDALLSGDAMLIMSYQLLGRYKSQSQELINLFSTTAMEVCEGQAMDMKFENSHQVEITDYIDMITRKTSVLIAASLALGAILGGAPDSDVKHLYEFGKNMGIAFQIQDDLLDSFGTEDFVGKKIGGDILQRKKTYLYLKSLELLSPDEAKALRELYNAGNDLDERMRIDNVIALFKKAHVDVHAQEMKLVYQQLAFSHLDAIKLENSKKDILASFAENLLNRIS